MYLLTQSNIPKDIWYISLNTVGLTPGGSSTVHIYTQRVHRMIYDIRGVSEKFGEWYQKTNKTEDTNKLTLLAL
jgi:hypothetical protein